MIYIYSSSKGKRAQVFFDLVFNGQITREEIEKILRAHSTYEDKDGLRYFKFRDFIVDINKILNPPVLPTRGPDIEIIGTIAHSTDIHILIRLSIKQRLFFLTSV